MIWIIATALLIYAAGLFFGWWLERRDWNNGACPCGKGWWKDFDTDSGGSTGYKCTDCGRVIWIGYPWVRK